MCDHIDFMEAKPVANCNAERLLRLDVFSWLEILQKSAIIAGHEEIDDAVPISESEWTKMEADHDGRRQVQMPVKRPHAVQIA